LRQYHPQLQPNEEEIRKKDLFIDPGRNLAFAAVGAVQSRQIAFA